MVALPYAVLGRLSPSVDRFLREFELAYHPAALHALALSPDRTAVVFVLVVGLSLLLLGLMRTVRYMHVEWIATQLMGLGVGLAVIGIVQKAFPPADANHPLVYGFWSPQANASPFGPFINHNHFAGWMVMALPLVGAYACAIVATTGRSAAGEARSWLRWASSIDGNRFLLVISAVMIMAVALVLTGSRSGMTSLAVGLVVLGYFVLRRMSGARSRVSAAISIGLVLVLAVGWAGSGQVVAKFDSASSDAEGRLAAWRDTRRIIEDFPVFGVGMGSYATAMLIYQTDGRRDMYAQAHNDYLQFAAEAGALVGIPALIALLIVLRGIWRRLSSEDEDPTSYWLRRGAVAGLLAIAIQSTVEFSLQMPGNDVLFVTLLAMALHRPKSSAHANRV
jgi:O-antigen ligase